MNALIKKALLVLLVLTICGVSIFPPDQRIRLGKDLRGGVTLLYDVQLEPGEDPGQVIPRMIDVLRERVDPNGLFEISIVRQGRDRLEITMPLPGSEARRLRSVYDEELGRLAERSISEAQLDQLVRVTDPLERSARLGRLARDNTELRELLTGLVEAYERQSDASAELEQMRQAGRTGEPEYNSLRRSVIDARVAYRTARSAVLDAVPTPGEVEEALNRSDRPLRLEGRDRRTTVTLDSPRQQAIDRLKDRYPEAAEQIERIVAAWDTYNENRRALDDPSDLIRLLRASGVLTFRITVDPTSEEISQQLISDLRQRLQDEGPQRARTNDMRWFRINRIEGWLNSIEDYEFLQQDPAGLFERRGYVVEEFDGEYWMLAWDRPGYRLIPDADESGRWSVAAAFATTDQLGRPAIGFRMDPGGARALGSLTGDNIGRQMAILLDDEVYTAPTLRARITVNGIIEGSFTRADIDYVVRVMSAGSLQARLSPSPISQTTVGPELGRDNLIAGRNAGVISLIAVAVFMVLYYLKAGLVAVVALTCNAILILGALSLNKAALTLPGIAGIILTFGMAVDANVIIYERIREELRAGLDLKAAVRRGYQKALSAIVDGNVTNLIVCIVLVLPGVATQEVKGFAITLGIGVIATMFSALVITRLIFQVLVDHMGMKSLKMAPTIFPVIERTLEPSIPWMRLRWVFAGISAIFVSLGIAMIAIQGSEMLDTEFVGGTQVELRFMESPDNGERIQLGRPEFQERINALLERVRADGNPATDELLRLDTANVIALNPGTDQTGRVVSSRYQVKTTIENEVLLVEELTRAFEDLLDIQPSMSFTGIEDDRFNIRPITSTDDVLGEFTPDRDVAGYPAIEAPEFRGGVAILLENITPAPSLENLRTSLDQVRQTDPAFRDTLIRTRTIHVLEGTEDAVTAALVLVRDPRIAFGANPAAWSAELAQVEWDLITTALGRQTTLTQVEKFSASVAETFRSRAIAAVLISFLLISIYIWVRFGSVRYSLAALTCLVHDVLIIIGMIAVAEILYESPVTQGIAQSLGIQPFKINLNLVAALLTIIGYSLNDSIIIMDRIRENRGKLPYASAKVVNLSINQTISRTVITSGTTLMAVLILFLYGGEGVRAFSYALLIGVVFGTYSSIAVAGPLVWSRKRDRSLQREAALAPGGPASAPQSPERQ